jgi:hypothetical protein
MQTAWCMRENGRRSGLFPLTKTSGLEPWKFLGLRAASLERGHDRLPFQELNPTTIVGKGRAIFTVASPGWA